MCVRYVLFVPRGQTICLSPGGQTFSTHTGGGDKHFSTTGGGGTNIFALRGGQTFFVGGSGGHDDVDKEMDGS